MDFQNPNIGNHTAHEVFTPTQPAKLTFVDRDTINNDLVDALETPGTQIVVYGHTGSGKTTLLTNKLEQLYDGHITTRCMKGMGFDQILLETFDQISPFYEAERSITQTTSRKATVPASFQSIKASLDLSRSSNSNLNEVRALPPQLTPQALGRLIGESGQCWVIEDFHKIENNEKEKLSQLLKVFMDLAYEYPSLKIVCLGAVDTARQVVDYDIEMKERVAEIAIPLMTDDELLSIITKGEKLLNIKFPTSVKTKVIKHACGIASICHRLCLNMCTGSNIKYRQSTTTTIEEDCFNDAVEKYVRSASDTIKNSFELALRQSNTQKFNSSLLIIRALSTSPERGLSRIYLLKKIQEEEPNYTDYILKNHLKKLTEPEYGSIIRQDTNSNLYSFKDPFHRAYAQSLTHEKTIKKQNINKFIITILHDSFRTFEIEG